MLDENYQLLIENVSYIAKELDLEEDATIDEIITKIKILKSKRINMFEQLDYVAKANKYDSLVEKIKEKISERRKRINKLHPASDCELIDDIEREIKVLQKLLDAVEEVHNDNIIY